jgi:hypothetical protein
MPFYIHVGDNYCNRIRRFWARIPHEIEGRCEPGELRLLVVYGGERGLGNSRCAIHRDGVCGYTRSG